MARLVWGSYWELLSWSVLIRPLHRLIQVWCWLQCRAGILSPTFISRMDCEITDWIKQSCNFNWGKEGCVGRAGSPLASVGFCSGRNVLPRSSLQGCTSSFSFHCEPLLFAFHEKRGWKKEKGVVYYAANITKDIFCGLKKKKKAKKNANLWLCLYFQKRTVFFWCLPAGT